MIKRVNAIKSVFGLIITAGQLIIGLHLFTRLIDSQVPARWFASGLNFGNSYGYGTGSVAFAGPGKALLVVLGFMVFSFILITKVPEAVEKKERRMEFDLE